MKKFLVSMLLIFLSLPIFCDLKEEGISKEKKFFGLGVSYNLGALAVLNHGGQLQYNFHPHMALVAPFYFQYLPMKIKKHPVKFKRVNGGLGFRMSLDSSLENSHFYVQPSLRFGTTQIGVHGDAQYALTPEIMGGYAWVFSPGFMLGLGIGAQWEFLFGEDSKGAQEMKKYVHMTNLPVTWEISLGWLI